MEALKLTSDHVRNMVENGRDIYLVDFSEKYLEELLGKYDLSDRLAGVLLDIDKRISKDIKKGGQRASFGGKDLPVYSYQSISELEDASFLILNDYFNETYDKLSQWIKREENPAIYYYVNEETEIDLYYRKKYQDEPLRNLILFRSGPHASSYVKGMDFADNARALFEYMLSEHFDEKYELVWLVKDPEEYARYEKEGRVSFLSYDWAVSEKEEERDCYYRALCLAKYIFFTDAYGFARNSRHDQIRVQLWHGCGFKTRVNFVRCEKRYEYTTVISELYAKIHQDIYGLREEQVLVTGYGKQDWLFHPHREAWEALCIPKADKYIFWLPTFRMAKTGLEKLNEYDLTGQTGLPVVNTPERLQELDKLLGDLNTLLIIKLHPFQDQERLMKINMEHVVLLEHERLVETDVQINQLLGLGDGLISDYSSAAVDYLLLDKPIGFTLEDMKEYEESRGFVFDNIREWLPGAELFTFTDLCSFIREIGLGIDRTKEKRRRLKSIMHKYDDDQSCRRITEALGID